MHAANIRIPAPAAGDSSDVAQALEIASALWDRGDRGDAIRWVRRAVEAADEAGDAARVAALARAVADLGTASAPPPPPSHRPPPVSTRPPPPSSGTLPKPRAMPLRPPQPIRSAPTPNEVRRRVSVKLSVRDPNLLVVRPLAEGQSPPAGTREAFLVMADGEDADAVDSSRSRAR